MQSPPPFFLIYASLQLLAAVVAEDPQSAAADRFGGFQGSAGIRRPVFSSWFYNFFARFAMRRAHFGAAFFAAAPLSVQLARIFRPVLPKPGRYI